MQTDSQIQGALGSVLTALLSTEQPLCFKQKLTHLVSVLFYNKGSPFTVSEFVYVHIKVSWNWIDLENQSKRSRQES